MDTRILLIQERLKSHLTLGESHFREFKSALHGPDRKNRRKVSDVAKDVAKTLVAFANADGGTLIVGAEDDGAISGIPYSEDRIETLQNAPKSHVHPDTPLPGVRTHLVPMEGKTVLMFSVQKGTRHTHLTSDGRCLQRRDTDTVPVASEQIEFERHEQLSREYDQQWVDGATVSDLDIDLVNRVTETVSPGLSQEKCLQFLGLAEFDQEALRLRRAALLLFASNIRKWHTRSEIRLLQVSGLELLTGSDYNVIRDETHDGNVLELLSKVWEHVRQFLIQKQLAGGIFQFHTSYPEDACREAFVNAVAHRDYSIEGRPIEILLFNDRLEIRNPGRLLSTVKLSELRRGAGVHDSRNTYIARVLRELGYMQEMGEGIRRISALMNGHEMAPPEINSVDHSFLMSFSQRNIFSPPEQRWLDAFQEFDLSREEKLVVLLGRGGKLISPSQIWETLDIVDTEEYRQIIERLQTKGMLSSPVEKGTARSTARQKGIATREVPRFAIRTPDIAQRDQREVVDALASMGHLSQIRQSEYELIRQKISGQNIYRGTVKIRNLLRWLDLVDTEGAPTELLRNRWRAAQSPLETESASMSSRRRSKPDVAEKPRTSVTPVRDIYVGNLDDGATEREIRELFEGAGSVASVTLPKDYLSGRNRGYAFVRMSDAAMSLKAFMQLNGHLLRNRPIRLGWSFR